MLRRMTLRLCGTLTVEVARVLSAAGQVGRGSGRLAPSLYVWRGPRVVCTCPSPFHPLVSGLTFLCRGVGPSCPLAREGRRRVARRLRRRGVTPRALSVGPPAEGGPASRTRGPRRLARPSALRSPPGRDVRAGRLAGTAPRRRAPVPPVPPVARRPGPRRLWPTGLVRGGRGAPRVGRHASRASADTTGSQAVGATSPRPSCPRRGTGPARAASCPPRAGPRRGPARRRRLVRPFASRADSERRRGVRGSGREGAVHRRGP